MVFKKIVIFLFCIISLGLSPWIKLIKLIGKLIKLIGKLIKLIGKLIKLIEKLIKLIEKLIKLIGKLINKKECYILISIVF
jgi:hypothetical protein